MARPAATGVYLYGSSGGFPSSSYGSSNYWVDVAFSPGVSGDSLMLGAGTVHLGSISQGVVPAPTDQGVRREIAVSGPRTSDSDGSGDIAALDTILAEWSSCDSSSNPITKHIKGRGPGNGDASDVILMAGMITTPTKWVITYGADTITKKRTVAGTII